MEIWRNGTNENLCSSISFRQFKKIARDFKKASEKSMNSKELLLEATISTPKGNIKVISPNGDIADISKVSFKNGQAFSLKFKPSEGPNQDQWSHIRIDKGFFSSPTIIKKLLQIYDCDSEESRNRAKKPGSYFGHFHK